MELGAKLQIKPGQLLAIVASGGGVPQIVVQNATRIDAPEQADAIVAFVRSRADLSADAAAAAIEGARLDKLAWIAYPKAGQLGTDLNRDRLCEELADKGVRPVRQIAIDEVWSALRFRPA
ncbi:hypothetical protein ACEZCY_04490 [Streptacidiphilus sp. N1-12]|uniref:Uncharacterized protein n=2 Tax=Streptacidiphilus alkalitolerans TaxID=3342712 RepID=A0ABV6V489_9ACTN